MSHWVVYFFDGFLLKLLRGRFGKNRVFPTEDTIYFFANIQVLWLYNLHDISSPVSNNILCERKAILCAKSMMWIFQHFPANALEKIEKLLYLDSVSLLLMTIIFRYYPSFTALKVIDGYLLRLVPTNDFKLPVSPLNTLWRNITNNYSLLKPEICHAANTGAFETESENVSATSSPVWRPVKCGSDFREVDSRLLSQKCADSAHDYLLRTVQTFLCLCTRLTFSIKFLLAWDETTGKSVGFGQTHAARQVSFTPWSKLLFVDKKSAWDWGNNSISVKFSHIFCGN